MPGYNGTGPADSGPMTGRGTGYCYSFDRNIDRRRNFRSRRNHMDDRCIRYGRRRRFRDRLFASPQYDSGYGQQIKYPEREYTKERYIKADREYYQKVLKEEAAYLKTELEAIEKRIEELKTNEEER